MLNLSTQSSLALPSATSCKNVENYSPDNVPLTSTTDLSLSVNYIPSKFARFRNRKGRPKSEFNLPKNGGGLHAFKPTEARMHQGKGMLRWNKFKWILFLTNSLFMIYSMVSLVVCLLIWFDIWQHADVIRVGNTPELIISTIASCVGIFTSLIGWAGILLNNRSFLAWYTFLSWITFALLVTPGYITYKRRTFNLEGKINAQWSRNLTTGERLRIQNQLTCCGYFSPFVEATISQTCYARSILQGCKGPYLAFERILLRVWYTAAFSLVPPQILVMVAGLLCSNHITYKFGKGMMPEAYRLDMNTMAVLMDSYAQQLADRYGTDIASDILKRTTSASAVPDTQDSLKSPKPKSTHSVHPYPFHSTPHTSQSLYRAF